MMILELAGVRGLSNTRLTVRNAFRSSEVYSRLFIRNLLHLLIQRAELQRE